jgi:HD-like signal output (HDOD) protein
VLAAKLPEKYAETMILAREEKISLVSAEHRVFGAAYPEVGAYLLGLWGLPDAIVEAVAFHHQPSACPAQSFSPLTAVHIADCLEEQAKLRASEDREPTPLDYGYLSRLGLAPERERDWQQLYRQMLLDE